MQTVRRMWVWAGCLIWLAGWWQSSGSEADAHQGRRHPAGSCFPARAETCRSILSPILQLPVTSARDKSTRSSRKHFPSLALQYSPRG